MFSVNAEGVWPEDPKDLEVRLRAFYQIYAPENTEKAPELALKFANLEVRA